MRFSTVVRQLSALPALTVRVLSTLMGPAGAIASTFAQESPSSHSNNASRVLMLADESLGGLVAFNPHQLAEDFTAREAASGQRSTSPQ